MTTALASQPSLLVMTIEAALARLDLSVMDSDQLRLAEHPIHDAHSRGLLSDEDYKRLCAPFLVRKAAILATRANGSTAIADGLRRSYRPTIFAPKPYRRPVDPDERKERMMRLGNSGALPPDLAKNFHPGGNAVARVIRDRCTRHGACILSMKEIADICGISRKWVVKTIRRMEALGLINSEVRPVKGSKNDTNRLTIPAHTEAGKAWRAWINRPHVLPVVHQGIGGTPVLPSQDLTEKEKKTAWRVNNVTGDTQGVDRQEAKPPDRKFRSTG